MPQALVDYDVCIIGAGPAGMMAAIAAGQAGVSVCVLERNSSAGRKLLLTGGGRCNLTHAEGIDDFVRACHPYGNTLKPAFYTLSPDQTLAFFHQRGLKTYTDGDRCVFPVSEHAADVCQVLTDQLRQTKGIIYTGQAVTAVEKKADGFTVITERGQFLCRALIVATGGKSWPQTGSTGDGYKFAGSLGHTVLSPVGILCPMVVHEHWVGDLQGLSLPDIAIRVKVKSGAKIFTGEMVFTSNGIGGPAVFDVSRIAVELLNHRENVPVTIDFLPGIQREQLTSLLIDRCVSHPKKEIAGLLCEWFPKRLSAFLQRCACGAKPVMACVFEKTQRQKLTEVIKAMPLTLIRSGSLEKATVTRGGVNHREIDFKTMQSRLCPGLFFAGEVVDVDGPCGGYNLQIAFSTGCLAGKSAADYVRS